MQLGTPLSSSVVSEDGRCGERQWSPQPAAAAPLPRRCWSPYTLSSEAMAFMQIGVASESFTPETQRTTFMKMYNEGGTPFARKEFYFNNWPVVSVFLFIGDSLLKYYFTTTCSMQTHV